MMDPRDHVVDAVGFVAGRNMRSVDHQHRQFQFARGIDFRTRACSAGILRHDQINAMVCQKSAVKGLVKRPARDYDVVIWQGRNSFGRIDKAQQIVMLRGFRKGRDVGATNRKEDAFGFGINGLHGAFGVSGVGPKVRVGGLPRRTRQGDQRQVCTFGCRDGVLADGGGEGVRGVDDVRDVLVLGICRKAVRAAKTADANWDRLRIWSGDTARIRQRCGQSKGGDLVGQRAGFGGAAKDQKVRDHV